MTKVTGAQTILFIAGQVAYYDTGGPPAGGGTLADIVKITTFLTDIRYREELVPIREEFFGKTTPAATQVAVSALGRPEWLIEVEAIAVL